MNNRYSTLTVQHERREFVVCVDLHTKTQKDGDNSLITEYKALAAYPKREGIAEFCELPNKYSDLLSEICDKVGNPLDALDSYIQFAIKENGSTQNLSTANQLIEKLKEIFDSFRKRAAQSEKKYSEEDMPKYSNKLDPTFNSDSNYISGWKDCWKSFLQSLNQPPQFIVEEECPDNCPDSPSDINECCGQSHNYQPKIISGKLQGRWSK